MTSVRRPASQRARSSTILRARRRWASRRPTFGARPPASFSPQRPITSPRTHWSVSWPISNFAARSLAARALNIPVWWERWCRSFMTPRRRFGTHARRVSSGTPRLCRRIFASPCRRAKSPPNGPPRASPDIPRRCCRARLFWPKPPMIPKSREEASTILFAIFGQYFQRRSTLLTAFTRPTLKERIMTNREGTPIWYELLTTAPDAAQDFYAAVTGWKFQTPPGGLERGYRLFSDADGEGIGGVMQMPEGAPFDPIWAVYFGVEDVDASAAKVKSLGGSVHIEPQDIPGVAASHLSPTRKARRFI